MKKLLLITLGIMFLFSACSPLGKKVDKELSDNHFYAKRKKRVLYCTSGNWFELGARPMDADRKTFQVLNGIYGKDAERAYYEDITLPKEMIDLASFQAVDGEEGSYLAKDKNHVFRMESGNTFTILEDADPNTFEAIDYYFQKDQNQVFFNYEKTGADASSFHLINNRFAQDKNQAFYIASKEMRTIDGVNGPLSPLGKFHAYDHSNIYYYSLVHDTGNLDEPRRFPYTNKASIELSEENYVKADGKVYVTGKEIRGADFNSFEIVLGFYSKDQNNVYYFEQVVEGADPSTFTYDDDSWSYKDANYTYERGKRITE